MDADQKTSSPFYVRVDLENVGHQDLSGGSPGAYLNGVDDRGQDQNKGMRWIAFDEKTGKSNIDWK